MNYTKGEWKASKSFENQTHIIFDVNPRRIDMLASIKWGSNIKQEEQLGNGYLISAAPEMYEALKTCRILFETYNKVLPSPNYEILDYIDKVLHKAEGK